MNCLPSWMKWMNRIDPDSCCSLPQCEPAKGSSDHTNGLPHLSAQLVFIGEGLELARDREAVKLPIGMGE
jgi:hypothetical protein